jgi:hypothetical protein
LHHQRIDNSQKCSQLLEPTADKGGEQKAHPRNVRYIEVKDFESNPKQVRPHTRLANCKFRQVDSIPAMNQEFQQSMKWRKNQHSE